MPPKRTKTSAKKRVENFRYKSEKRTNIPTAETQSFMRDEEMQPKPLRYKRNPDLDPQLVWKGKDEQNDGSLSVATVPIYIQEKIQPRQIINDLKRLKEKTDDEPNLFADFNGLPDHEARLEFYAHQQNWSNRMILGDSLLVMNSLAEKEKLRGRVQMIYMDPPYGIKFGSNWQPSTKKRDVKDGKADDFSREPEVIKAFRDTWELGIHSYLSYLRDRLTVARELLTDSGSIFVQIGDENVHLVRSLLDEVFGRENFLGEIIFQKTGGQNPKFISKIFDVILWYGKNKNQTKYRSLYTLQALPDADDSNYVHIHLENGHYRSMNPAERRREIPLPDRAKIFRYGPITSAGVSSTDQTFPFNGKSFSPSRNSHWKTNLAGMRVLSLAERILISGSGLAYKLYWNDFAGEPISNIWIDTQSGGFNDPQIYVVQTTNKVIQRCLLMTTDPGDLVLDPTCGSGTTAYVAEQWGRRWITIDTSRVALALARTRLMSGRFSHYILADSPQGLRKESEATGKPVPDRSTNGDICRGFVYERVPHITLKSIANNAEIDVIYERYQPSIETALKELNKLLGKKWQEWEVPRELDATGPTQKAHAAFWEARREKQKEIDASIARNADIEYLYDRPYEDKGAVRVTGPFTVESLSPHRVLPTDDDDEALLDALDEEARARGEEPAPRPKRTQTKPTDDSSDFVRVVIENLKSAGVQNTRKNERLVFSEVKPWAGGQFIHAEGRYEENGKEKRAAVFIGPEYGTVTYQMVRSAAREAIDTFDILIACGFAFEANVSNDSMSLGRLVVLKARMNSDLHMAEHLKKTGAGNLFVVFGEPDIKIHETKGGQVQVQIKGVDVFDPTTGDVRSGATDDIACWFIDTDYDEESFFVRHAYFLGAKDPYDKLKRTLKADIDEAAWSTLHSATSRPFPKPSTGKIAVKVINHYGDEVLKVYKVD